jgi:hypothetical protein
VFEMLIRPKGYGDLIQSDKAFAPSTARHINRFHLVFEIIALLTFIPELTCTRNIEMCMSGSIFSRVQASLYATLGSSSAEAAKGRFILGLTALRCFGLVRHWKQMWINKTFHPVQGAWADRQDHKKWLEASSRSIGKKTDVRTSKRLHYFSCANS